MPDVITNEIGEPRLFYHGSYKPIPTFKALRWQGVGGIYFTHERDVGEDFARCGCMEEGDVPTLMVAHLAMGNPFRMYGIDSQVITTDRIAELEALGHDGVIGMTDDG